MLRKVLLTLASVATLGFATAALAQDIPDAPPMPTTSDKITPERAGRYLDSSEAQGGHARGKHVGRTGKQLKDRNIDTATTYQKKVDQNLAGRDMMNNPKAVQTRNEVAGKHLGNKKAVTTQHTGGLRPIGKVVEKRNGKFEEHNIKVDETTTVLKKGPNGVNVLTQYPSKYTKLPKPSAGPSLKPTKAHGVTDIATGKGGLRKVPAPQDKPLQLDGQKKFGNVTKVARERAQAKQKDETAPTQTAPKQTAKKQPAPKTTAKKQPVKKQPAKTTKPTTTKKKPAPKKKGRK